MKEKILKITVGIIIVTILIILAVISYFMYANIETTQIPSEGEYSCLIDRKEYSNRKVFIITPKNVPKSEITILYFHGGSYMAEINDEHWAFLERVINDTGATVILPDYPLSPKYNYKDVFNMVEPLYKEIINKVSPENLIVMGDSAGGGLSLALVEKISLDGASYIPSKTILISPWLDVRLNNPKIDDIQKKDKKLNKDALKLAGIAYANPDGIDSYLVNPIDGNLEKLKNVTIFTGTYDILNPDVHVLDEKAKKQGTKIDIREYDKASHIWILSKSNSEKDLKENAYKDLINVIKE